MNTKIIGKNLKKYRTRQNLSLAQVKEKVGLDRSYLSRIENGIDKISNESLINLINLYQLTREESAELANLANLPFLVHSQNNKNDILNDEKVFSSNKNEEVNNMQEKNQQEKSLQETTAGRIEINVPADVKILYSDSAWVTASNYGIVMDFAQIMGNPSKQQVVSRVGMSREHAEALLGVLQQKIVELQNKSDK